MKFPYGDFRHGTLFCGHVRKTSEIWLFYTENNTITVAQLVERSHRIGQIGVLSLQQV